ncbi:hypothetical protein H2200_009685 [Cladophialophora chaetospira]|uniref:Uncharacterized protein n=1 Tax=Cladophialophora chaetospira TaxID=386627 RepID=A0AA38X2W6_9EURO|nr:hypothetical protein H2200_009685 [Cladophialophora chaetospira]
MERDGHRYKPPTLRREDAILGGDPRFAPLRREGVKGPVGHSDPAVELLVERLIAALKKTPSPGSENVPLQGKTFDSPQPPAKSTHQVSSLGKKVQIPVDPVSKKLPASDSEEIIQVSDKEADSWELVGEGELDAMYHSDAHVYESKLDPERILDMDLESIVQVWNGEDKEFDAVIV